jgi:predicted Zn-dependent peptidase
MICKISSRCERLLQSLVCSNNVTLTIAGDFDITQAKTWYKKYFGEIKRGQDIPKMENNL